MGHLALRNDSSGVDEQLDDGKNGYFIDHRDINQFAAKIEMVLNKETSSNEDLQRMGAKSQEMIAPYAIHSYLENLGE